MNDVLDSKLCKKSYPRTNNEDVLEFVFEKDPNLFLRKNKIIIRGQIEVSSKLVVDNGFASKLFSMRTVEVDSQAVTINTNRLFCLNIVKITFFFRHDFFLADYISKIGNFNQSYLNSVFSTEGYFDGNNYGTDVMSTDAAKKGVDRRRDLATQVGNKFVYEFVLCPNVGFLAGPDPLVKDAELKISFDELIRELLWLKLTRQPLYQPTSKSRIA